MTTGINSPARLQRAGRRPLWLSILAGFSLLLGIVTTIPQFYYVLFGLHLVTIGPNSNLLGQVWYSYILNGDNSYLKVDPGTLAGAVEDAFLLGPLYIATGVGLWLRRAWVIPVGLITGAMIFYAIIGFFLGDIFAGLPSVTNDISYWASNLPYLLYPLWLVPVLLFRRSLFARKEPGTS
ncbi:MAG: hypothetical protein ACRDIV_16125 [Ktedonobacteraceae bacterium]